MINLKVGCILVAVITMTLILTVAPLYAGSALAVKKSTSSVKTPKGTTTNSTHHVKGVKVFRVHTVPSKVAVGNTFGLRGIVFNNSTTTITFANGTCTSPLSITFNKNVMIEPQATTASCKAQQVTLKPGEQSPVLSPNLSGLIYRSTAPGMTNATMTFKYGALTSTSKSPISDSISRVYAFNILPAGHQLTSSQSTPSASSSSSQPGVLKLVP
jgi:hypothetical protein